MTEDPRDLTEVVTVTNPGEGAGEGTEQPAAGQDDAQEPEQATNGSGLPTDAWARVVALQEAKELLTDPGDNFPGLRAQAGELTALATFILTGVATWVDEDPDLEPV